ncbi:hypothetical protein ACJO1P_05655 [Vibrio parahaemolyticus]|uniref:hypothetical protein n=1 Tax=Vibrio parahaemolyticus TaxID=670 RepID=UPI00387B800D
MTNKNRKKPILMVNQSFVDPNSDAKIQQAIVKYEFIYSLIGLIMGLSCIFGGIVLCLNGVFGSTSWTVNILGAESAITDAAPGVVLFIVGVFSVYITRYKFTHK